MHKRRLDSLEPLVKQINIKVYSEFYQQLTDEIARAYADMVDHKVLCCFVLFRFVSVRCGY